MKSATQRVSYLFVLLVLAFYIILVCGSVPWILDWRLESWNLEDETEIRTRHSRHMQFTQEKHPNEFHK
jgi:hypothetical protein